MTISDLKTAVSAETRRRALIRMPRVQEITGNGKSWIYAAIRRGEFPAPVRCGPKNVAWVEDEIYAWVEARIAEADAKGRTQGQPQ